MTTAQLLPGMEVTTLDGEGGIVEWIKSENEIAPNLPYVSLNVYVKLVGKEQLELLWDLEWDGMFDDLPELSNHGEA
jgi:hypothetical protein